MQNEEVESRSTLTAVIRIGVNNPSHLARLELAQPPFKPDGGRDARSQLIFFAPHFLLLACGSLACACCFFVLHLHHTFLAIADKIFQTFCFDDSESDLQFDDRQKQCAAQAMPGPLQIRLLAAHCVSGH